MAEVGPKCDNFHTVVSALDVPGAAVFVHFAGLGATVEPLTDRMPFRL